MLEVSLLIVLEDMPPSLRTRMVNGCRELLTENNMVALNTFFPGNSYIWTKVFGRPARPARLDYICANSELLAATRWAGVRKDIDVRVGSAQDHWLVVADVHLSIGEPSESRRKQTASIDRNLVHDQQRVLNFQNQLEHVVLRDELEIGPICSALTADVANAAFDCFRKCQDVPRKDWISGHSWWLIKWAQSLRTDLRNARANVNGMRLAVAFNGWRCIATGDRDAIEWTRAAYTSWYTVCRHAALALKQLESAQSQKRNSLKTDRRTQWESIAGDAQRAADNGDTRELYTLARRLGAFKPTPVPGVKLKGGTLASDDDAGLARWAEHFAALLGGKQVDSVKAPNFERHDE